MCVKYISSYSWFCENSCVYPSKKGKKKKWTKTQIYLLTFSSLSGAVHLTFSFSQYYSFAAKHASTLLTYFFYGGFNLLLWNASNNLRLGFLDHLGTCFEGSAAQFTFQRWKQPEFRKPFSTERLFPISIFLISYKILWCNIVRLKHPFSCLHGDTLSGNKHYFHVLTKCVLFLSRMKQTLFLLLSHASKH